MDQRRRALADSPCPCGNNRLTRDCHDGLLRPPSEEEFYAPIEQALELVPNLRRFMPQGFPRTGSAAVPFVQSMAFEDVRTGRYVHNIDLLLVLHLAGNESAVPGGRMLARSLLGIFDAFALRFHRHQGAARVFEALWRQVRDANDPSFWSVLSTCYWACRCPQDVIGFELATGKGAKSADLVLQLPDGRAFVEIEVWHQPPEGTAEEFATALNRRFRAKAENKFPRFTAPDFGVIVQAAFVNEGQLQLLREHPDLLGPVDFGGESRWVGQLIAVAESRDATGSLRGPAFIDFLTPVRPPPPS